MQEDKLPTAEAIFIDIVLEQPIPHLVCVSG